MALRNTGWHCKSQAAHPGIRECKVEGAEDDANADAGLEAPIHDSQVRCPEQDKLAPGNLCCYTGAVSAKGWDRSSVLGMSAACDDDYDIEQHIPSHQEEQSSIAFPDVREQTHSDSVHSNAKPSIVSC